MEAARELERARSIRQLLTQASDRTTRDEPARILTPRERDVLRLVADGLGNPAIAIRLGISEHTVHRHVANMLVKLGVPSRAAAVATAARLGLL